MGGELVMPLAVWYWVFYVIGFLFYGYDGWLNRGRVPYNAVPLVLFFLIGLAVFGSPVQGTR